MRYVIIRDDGKYVTRPGSEHSYTRDIREALIVEAPDRSYVAMCCENERVVPLDDELRGLSR